MRLQPLYDLQQDINRLFIAGSKFAKGDPRLLKHTAILNKLGEKAPVFKKLATDIEELVNADTQHSAEKLMSISTLLYSVLYTQGELLESDVEKKEQVPNIAINNVNTAFSYLQLKPVIEALSTSSSGRLELLTDALERKIFSDSRTYPYLDMALADKYSELAEYVANTIIPRICKPIIPFLIQNFKYEDKTEHVRRLHLLHAFEYDGINQMIGTILSMSLPSLQAECIRILQDDSENEELILTLADDKNKIVREAAYLALAKLNTENSLNKLTEVYIKNKNKGTLEGITTALATSKLPYFFQKVFDKVVESFEEFIALSKDDADKTLSDKLDRLSTNLKSLENKDNQEIEQLFIRILKDKSYNSLIAAKKPLLEYSAGGVTTQITTCLQSMGSSKELAFYEREINDIPLSNWTRELWCRYFEVASRANYSAEKIYDVFHPSFKKQIVQIHNLCEAFSNYSGYYNYNEKAMEVYTDKIDKRWLELLYAQFEGKLNWNYQYNQALHLLNACEPKSDKFDQLLIDLTKRVTHDNLITVFKLIVDRNLKDRFNIVYSIMEKFSKNTSYYSFYRLNNVGFWKSFPKEYALKFRTLYDKNQLRLFAEIAEEIEEQK